MNIQCNSVTNISFMRCCNFNWIQCKSPILFELAFLIELFFSCYLFNHNGCYSYNTMCISRLFNCNIMLMIRDSFFTTFFFLSNWTVIWYAYIKDIETGKKRVAYTIATLSKEKKWFLFKYHFNYSSSSCYHNFLISYISYRPKNRLGHQQNLASSRETLFFQEKAFRKWSEQDTIL